MELKDIETEYKKIIAAVEVELRNYPFYLIAIENNHTREEMNKSIVSAIKSTYEKLDEESKKIIEDTYFKENFNREDIIRDLRINKNKYYTLKKNALNKFSIALGFK